ncbi:Protein FLOWERING LOCUS T, partial [Mucuna pruriens]
MGIHRFVFVLFRQQYRQRVYAPGWRQNFNTREFAELYNLGLPVAAVFYNCQRETGSGDLFLDPPSGALGVCQDNKVIELNLIVIGYDAWKKDNKLYKPSNEKTTIF